MANSEKVVESKIKQKQRQKHYHDKGAKPLKELPPGSAVRVRTDQDKHWSEKAVVLQQVVPKSYLVRTERGAILRRNRKDLMKTREIPSMFVDNESEDESEPDLGETDLKNNQSPRRPISTINQQPPQSPSYHSDIPSTPVKQPSVRPHVTGQTHSHSEPATPSVSPPGPTTGKAVYVGRPPDSFKPVVEKMPIRKSSRSIKKPDRLIESM